MFTNEFLPSLVDLVGCTGCGRCCPKDCPHLAGNRCDIHPYQHQASPQLASCELKPMELVLYYGIFCPPALETIEASTQTRVSPSRMNPRFCNTEELDTALGVYLQAVLS